MKKLIVAAVVSLCLLACSEVEQATDTPIPPTPTATLIPPTPTAKPIPQTLTDIDYRDDRSLDVYLPGRDDRPWPTVLLLHGAGGEKSHMSWLADDLTALGYAVVVPSWGPPGFPADNALCSLAWLHGNAETYGLDPQRIAVFGHSGGGTFGVLMAAIDEPAEFLQECPYDLPKPGAVQGAISYAGSFIMPEWYLTQGRDLFEAVIAQELQVSRDEAEEIRQVLLDTPFERWLDITDFDDNVTHFIHMLPPAWIDGSEPPILLVHGGSDNMIGRLESEAFAALLEAEGVEVQLLIIPSADHDLGPYTPGFEETWNATQAFLAEILE